MPTSSPRRAVEAHRRRLAERGIRRFEVRGLESDKDLIRGLARRLAANDREAGALRSELARRVAGGEPIRTGGVLAALRSSPLVGADLDLSRESSPECDVGL